MRRSNVKNGGCLKCSDDQFLHVFLCPLCCVVLNRRPKQSTFHQQKFGKDFISEIAIENQKARDLISDLTKMETRIFQLESEISDLRKDVMFLQRENVASLIANSKPSEPSQPDNTVILASSWLIFVVGISIYIISDIFCKISKLP